MKKSKLQAIVFGALGKTGGEVLSALTTNQSNNEQKIEAICGVDCRAKPEETKYGVPIYSSLNDIPVSLAAREFSEAFAGVIIDFSSAQGLEDRLRFAETHHAALVIGTTGFSAPDNDLILQYSKVIPVFRAANFSLGAAVTEMLCATARRQLGSEFNSAIIETHHQAKQDAPSGTALSIAKAIDCASNNRLAATQIYSLRLGTVTGKHEIVFAGTDESVTIIHHAQSRKIFALGAIKAAGFLCGKPAGLYGMKDLLNYNRYV